MIDEKKIEEAQETFFEEEVYGKGEDITYNDLEGEFVCREERYDGGHIRDAFKAGVKWAQQEFIKSLWHDASEEPDVRHKTIICLYKDGVISQDYEVYDEATEHDSHNLVMGEFDWEYYAREAEIEKWAYKNDILPKEGGEE